MSTCAATRTLVVLLAAAATLAACGGPDRPSAAEWRQTWETAQAVIPSPSELDPPSRQATCQRVLGELRNIRPTLTPGPDRLVDREVDAWVDYAEHVFFTCFEANPGSAEEAYRQLARLTTEVDAALRTVSP